MMKTLALILSFALLAVLLASCGEGDGGVPLSVYCFSAGKADAFLITTESSAVLIDTGLKGFGKEFLAYLEENGIERLDYLIITHFDKDHVGGAAKVINGVQVENVLQSYYPKNSSEYENYLSALEKAGINAKTVTSDISFTLDGVSYIIDAAKGGYTEDESNNSSLVVTVKDGENSLLFMGDAETERIREFLRDSDGTYDFIKIPHHGKEEPLLEELLSATSPKYAVITSSLDDPESEETLAALRDAGVETYLTRVSPILVQSDGKSVKITYKAG